MIVVLFWQWHKTAYCSAFCNTVKAFHQTIHWLVDSTNSIALCSSSDSHWPSRYGSDFQAPKHKPQIVSETLKFPPYVARKTPHKQPDQETYEWNRNRDHHMRALDIDFESFACRLMRIGRSESESEFNERALRLISDFGFGSGFWLCKLLYGSKRIRYFDRVNGREVRGARWEAGGGPRLDLYYFLKVKKAFNWTVLWICRFFVRRRCVVSFSAFVFHFHFFICLLFLSYASHLSDCGQ